MLKATKRNKRNINLKNRAQHPEAKSQMQSESKSKVKNTTQLEQPCTSYWQRNKKGTPQQNITQQLICGWPNTSPTSVSARVTKRDARWSLFFRCLTPLSPQLLVRRAFFRRGLQQEGVRYRFIRAWSIGETRLATNHAAIFIIISCLFMRCVDHGSRALLTAVFCPHTFRRSIRWHPHQLDLAWLPTTSPRLASSPLIYGSLAP